MSSLRELQQAFADGLLATDGRAPACALAGDGAARFAIYRRAMFANYHNALAATYPAVQRLLGASRFRAATGAYVRAHPSRGGDLNVYGDTFGDFLDEGAAELGLPYLPDVARLEWAIDEASRATDFDRAPEALLAALSGVPASRLPSVRLRLAPSCRLLESIYPVLRIWRDDDAEPAPDASARAANSADRLLVRRDGSGAVIVERLGPGEFAWLATLHAGRTLAAAIDAAQLSDPGFELGAALHAHIGNGTVAAIDVG